MPVIQLKKVNRAIRALEKVVLAQEKLEAAFNALNDAEEQEFLRITGVT
jgi:hypothetical protein